MKKIKNRLFKKIKQFIEYLNSDFSKSRSSNKNYPKYCNDAATNEKIFENFRSNKSYTGVLEHVSFKLAKEYHLALNELGVDDKQIYDFCKILNSPGNPEKIKLSHIDNNISPSSLRYLYTGLDIRHKLNIKNKVNIVEIGAGYGGQSLILDKLVDIGNYTFVDLNEVNRLIDKFVSNFDINFSYNFLTLEDDFENHKQFDIVISNYAFSELPRNLQDLAIDKIIKKSKQGYMIINSDGLENNFFMKKYNFYKIEELKRIIPNIKVFEESPNSHKNNKVLIF